MGAKASTTHLESRREIEVAGPGSVSTTDAEKPALNFWAGTQQFVDMWGEVFTELRNGIVGAPVVDEARTSSTASTASGSSSPQGSSGSSETASRGGTTGAKGVIASGNLAPSVIGQPQLQQEMEPVRKDPQCGEP
mmetsp:Transcript_4300/g.10603  ORF Transcript_4300/g.10603 Transcript_4300/m.10603 type:complete len:136 (-) Transcript_4300:45-452(-)